MRLSKLNKRRIDNFKKNKRGYYSFWIFSILFLISLFANFIANEKPLLINSIMKTLNLIDLENAKPPVGNSSSLMDLQIPNVISGKVRDRWDIGNDLLCFYHSDRLSSFDRHICNIDGKGRILNLMNSWWMNRTRHMKHVIKLKKKYLI